MKRKIERYIDFINDNILPYIDYRLLQRSYRILLDKSYAKAVLNELTIAARNIYGDTAVPEYKDDDFVLVPGIVQAEGSGNLCLALLELDLSSSGEHWGTQLLSRYGVISFNDIESLSYDERLFLDTLSPYDYAYTINIPCDIHLKTEKLTEKVKTFLGDYSNHYLSLPYKAQDMNLQEDEELEDQEI